MKRLLILLFSFVLLLALPACQSTEIDLGQNNDYFLRDIRPTFFERIDFNSPERVAELPAFLVRFTDLYGQLEQQHKAGAFTSRNDLDNMRLAGMYYSFLLTATVRANLDGFIRFEDIVGNRTGGFLSNLKPDAPNFRMSELRAMADRAVAVAQFAVYVNGFNDKTLGALMVGRQVRGRVYTPQFFNDPAAHDSTIRYVGSTIKDYDFFRDWNSFMSQLSFTNYADPLNTFANPNMNIVLANLNARPVPYFPNRFATMVGPLFRFDMNMKKVDWLIQKDRSLTTDELAEIRQYIATMNEVRVDVNTTRKALLDQWPYKSTVALREAKLTQIEQYVEAVQRGQTNVAKPQLSVFFSSKDFLQAYQCYNCHRSVQ